MTQSAWNEEVLPMFEHTCQLAKLQPLPPEMLRLLNALRANQNEIGRFLGTVTGTSVAPVRSCRSRPQISS
jgi:hypothetical protein